MKTNTTTKLGITLAGVLALTITSARADSFGSGGNAFTIDFVTIGNAGNADDAGAGGGIYSRAEGGVAYEYRMGVTEVPLDWITKATNLGMTGVAATAPAANRPAENVTWWEAATFVNWLNTSAGHTAAYNITGGPNASVRNPNAYYFLPSVDEFYKAAYHKNDGVTANYWDYATGSNAIPTAVAGGTAAGTAVYNGQAGTAAVDNAGGLSPYGTMGQNGNVREWNEGGASVPTAGGGYNLGEGFMRSSDANSWVPYEQGASIGFRVASVVPEPTSALLLLGSGAMLLLRRRRRA